MRIVKNRLTLAAFGAAAFACGLLVATAAGVLALPIPTVPQRVDIPCRVPYELAAGERALLFCMPRNYTLRGGERATAQSRHEDVDIAVIDVLPGGIVLSVTNRSTHAVTGVAHGAAW